MSSIGHISITTGTTTAIGAAMIQSSVSTTSTVIVPAVSAIIGAIVSFVVLRTTVQRMEHDMRDTRKDISEMYNLLRESLTKIAHLEGRLEQRS